MATLVPDAATIQQSLGAIKTEVGGFAGLLGTIANMDLSDASISAAVLDAESPDVYNAMVAEQQNVKDFLALNIVADIVAGVQAFAGTFQSESGKMLDIYTVAGTGALSPAQQSDLDAAMAGLMSGITAQVQLVETKSAGAKTLSDAIDAPDGNFATGETAIKAAIANAQTNLTGLQNMASMPGGDSQQIEMGIVVYQNMITAMNNLQSSVQSIVQANGAMGQALSQDLVIWQTLVGKYQAVADALKSANTDPTILSSGDIKGAQLGWSQIEAYAKSLT
jgi:hypothetical protein